MFYIIYNLYYYYYLNAVCLGEISQKANHALKMCQLKEDFQGKKIATVKSFVKLIMRSGEASLSLEQLTSKSVFCVISNADFCLE